jgi:hypothetical protein
MTTELICHEVRVASNSTSEGKQGEAKEEKEFQKKINAFLKKQGKEKSNAIKDGIQYQAVPLVNANGKTIAVKHCALIIY